jgi:hypothetical protein
MSETSTGGRASCAVCGKPLSNSWVGWRHYLFCSVECEQLAARRQLNQVASAAGHLTNKPSHSAGGASAPAGKMQSGHVGDAATTKPAPH